MTDMKKMILIGLLLSIIITQVSCSNASSSTENTPISTSSAESTPVSTFDNFEQIEQTYIDEVMKAAKGETVVKSFVEDFAMDGKKEAFILTRKQLSEMESKFSLWFVSNDKLETIKKDILALSSSTIELIRNNASVHVLFREEQFTINNNFIGTIYGVYNGEPKVLFEKSNLILGIEDDKIYGTEHQYCSYDSELKQLMVTAGVTYEFFWNEQEEKYMEYGADLISKREFLQYSGAEKIWEKLKRKLPMKNRKTKYTFLKRTNDTIDINMKTLSKNGYYKSYITLKTKDGEIVTTKIDFHDGNKKRCKYPEIGRFE